MGQGYRRRILHVGLLLAIAAHAAAGDISVPALDTHIRPASGDARTLIESAMARSPTVVRLMTELSETDVIVYVQLTLLPHVDTARTAFTAFTPRGRFLRILINARTPPWERIQLFGHELQHALEIAGAPEVTSDDGLRRLYGRIGRPGLKPDQFETVEAQRIQAIVRQEYVLSARKTHAVPMATVESGNGPDPSRTAHAVPPASRRRRN